MDVLYTFLGIITRKLVTAALDRFIGSKKPRSLKIRMWHPNAPANFNNFIYCNEISNALTKGYVPCRAFYAMVQLRNNGVYVLMLRARPNASFHPNNWLLPTMPSTEHDESLSDTAMKINMKVFHMDDVNPTRAAEIQTYATAMRMYFSFKMMPGWQVQIGTHNFRSTHVNQICFSIMPPMTPAPTSIWNIYTHAQWMRVDDIIQHLITTGITTGTTDINSLVVLHYIRWALEIPEIVALLQRQPPQNQNQ